MTTIQSLLKTSLLTLSIALSSQAMAGAKYSAGKYQIDNMHSKVGFEVAHLVISTVEGQFKAYQGTFDLAPNFKDSKVNAEVDIASIDTGVEKRDGHLKSADFFDAAKHPKMNFVSKSISGTPDNFTIKGSLTLKGVTKTVDFKGNYLGTVKDGWGNTKAAFNAKAKINRKDFGLTWSQAVEAGPVVGDIVTIELNIQGALQKPVKQASN